VELYQIFDFNFLVRNIHLTFDNPQFYERAMSTGKETDVSWDIFMIWAVGWAGL